MQDHISQTDTGHEPRAEAETIASQGTDVRERIRKAVVDAVRTGKFGMRDVSAVTNDVIDGAVEGARKLASKERESVLQQVIDGIGDAFTATAQAAKLSLEEAQGRGERFAKEDVQSAVKHLSAMQKAMTETVLDTLEKARTEASAQGADFINHARRVSERVQPSIEKALYAATQHPVKLAGETASASAKAVPKAVGTLLHAMSGLLQGAGDLLTGAGKPADKP